jgi:aconitate decarboxylase
MTAVRDALLSHIAGTRFESLPDGAVTAAKAAMASTIACGMAGSTAAEARALRDLQLEHFGFGGAPIWGTDQIMHPIAAGLINGFHVQSAENGPVHDAAGVQPMSVILPSVIAYADRFGQVSGKAVITAVNVGTDVACLLGLAAKQETGFFRTGVCGAMGAAAALAKLAGFDRNSATDIFGHVYSQLSGTRHTYKDAGMGLALQVALGVRNVLTAFDMARMYIPGAQDVFDGEYGYFNVFEPAGDAAPLLGALGTQWRSAEMSFKAADEHRAEFMARAASAAVPLAPEMAERLYTRLLALQDETDVSVLSNMAAGFDLEQEGLI